MNGNFHESRYDMPRIPNSEANLFTLHRQLRIDRNPVGKVAFIIVLASILSVQASAQNLKRIQRFVEKSQFDKAREQIDKTLSKDTTSFGAHYFLAVYFLDSSLNQYNLDSARIHINQALRYKESASADQLDNWSKTELSPDLVQEGHTYITKLSFQRAYKEPSVNSLNQFLALFPNSLLEDQAIFYRDSLAYELAMEEDGWQAYKAFLDNYPDSKFYPRAKSNYDILLFKSKTKDGSLKSLQDFLEEHPETPYRNTAENLIFQKMTITHQAEGYQNFISSYPDSHFRPKAADMLYYKDKESITNVLPLHPNPDSLITMAKLEQKTLAPILSDGAYGFMDSLGVVLDNVQCQAFDPAYKCGNLSQEWLRIKMNDTWCLVNRMAYVLKKNVTEVENVSSELMLVRSGSSNELYHKSGFQLVDFSIDDVQVLQDQWIAFQKNLHWGIMSFNGEIILQPTLQSIQQIGDFIVLESGGIYDVTNSKQLAEFSNKKPSFLFPYEDFDVVADTLFLGFADNRECLLSKHLEVLLPLDNQRIYVSRPIWYVKKNGSFHVFDRVENKIITSGFAQLDCNESWITMKTSGKWTLRGIQAGIASLTTPLDSARLINDFFAYIERRDSSILCFRNGGLLPIGDESQIQILTGDSASYIRVSEKFTQSVYDAEGNELLAGKFDEIKYLSDSIFIVKNRGKYGLYEPGSGFKLKITYDLINADGTLASLLKNNKIGCLDLRKNIIIPAVYESRIERFGAHYLVSKNGKKGVVTADNKPLVSISYDEIISWNDTSYWARTENSWSLDTYDGNTIFSNVISLRQWESESSDKYIFMQDDKYGIATRSKGMMIPPMYNDIINLGSTNRPLYFAEQHLKTAEFYVVTYFNTSGEAIKSQAYRSNEYDMIYCDR